MAAITRTRHSQLFLLILVFFVHATVWDARGQQLPAAEVRQLPFCSLAKTNTTCKLVIDRSHPVAPPQIQMYSNETLVVVLENPKPYERYFLDPVSGQLALYPDTGAAIVQGLIPSLGKLQIFHAQDMPSQQELATDLCAALPNTLPAVGQVASVVPAFIKCFVQLAGSAKLLYTDLEPYIAPDSLTPGGYGAVQPLDPTIYDSIKAFLNTEKTFTLSISAISTAPIYKANQSDIAATADLVDLQKTADTVAADLFGYQQRIDDLKNFSNGSQPCSEVIADKGIAAQCVTITSNPDSDKAYHNMVTRAITYTVNTYNLVSYSQRAAVDPSKKKSIGGNIVILFADTPSKPTALRWEASAGVFFSSLPIRSFAVGPVFDGSTVTNNIVIQNILRPTVVPFAAGNYRITDDLSWTKWKSNLYLTGGIGINPNTVSADFAAGLSLSWRTLLFSALWHYGHGTRLTQGFYVNESLGPNFKSTLPTQNYWTNNFAIGISIRVPPLTGR